VKNDARDAAISRQSWKSREQMEADESRVLAPFAQKSGESRGRKYPEPSYDFRTEFQHDRARIIHSRDAQVRDVVTISAEVIAKAVRSADEVRRQDSLQRRAAGGEMKLKRKDCIAPSAITLAWPTVT
jgi:hypothetical protein